MDGPAMFAQAQKEKRPFYEWHAWIEKQLDRLFLEYQYKKKLKQVKA